MKKQLLGMIVGCAVASLATAQTTFVMHFDSVQQGFPGTAYGIEEVPTGYLVTGLQHVPVGPPFTQHTFIRSIDHQGNFLSEVEWWADSALNYWQIGTDPIVKVNDTCFVSNLWTGVPGSFDWSPRIQFVKFDDRGDTIATSVILEVPLGDSLGGGVDHTCQLSDGGFAMVGALSEPGQSAKGWFIRLNADGDTLWTRQYGLANSGLYMESTSALGDGGFVSGGYRGGLGLDKVVLARLDSSGNMLWQQYFGMASSGRANVRVSPDGNIHTWSTYREPTWNPNSYSVQDLRKWTPAGALTWSKKTTLRNEIGAVDFEILADGAFITVAVFGGIASLMKFDAQGDSLWQRFFTPFNGPCTPLDVLPTSDGGFAFCGTSMQGQGDPTPGLQTMFVIKTDSMGCVVPGCQFTGLSDNVFGLENTLHAYPNPSPGAFTLELDLPENLDLAGDLLLQVFDMQGRQVVVRALGRDRHQRTTLDLTKEAAGLYSAHLSDGKRILTGVRLVRE